MENFTNNNYEFQDTESTEASSNSLHEETDSVENFETAQITDDEATFNPDSSETQRKPAINVFAFFARSLGIFAIFCAIFGIFFGAFICGGLAIILSVLSKGFRTKMEKNAMIGMVTGCIAIILQISTLIFSIYNIINVPEYRELFNNMYEQIYGEPVDESITDMLDELSVSI